MNEEPHYINDPDAIVTAASCGDGEIVRFLVEHGTDINVRDYLGRTALMAAVEGTFTPIVQYLLGCSADPNIPDNDGDTPLEIARYSSLFRVYRDAEIVSMLTEHGAKGREGLCEKELRDELIYRDFAHASAVKLAGSGDSKKKKGS